MKILQLKEAGVEECVRAAKEVLAGGGVIIYPTDTLYGLGADAFSTAGFEKVCMIKGRDERRPIHAIFANLASVQDYAVVTPMGEKLARAFLPGPLTLVFEKKPHLTTGIAHNIPSVGVRIPNNRFCLSLAQEFGKPFTTTSANVSHEGPLPTIAGIVSQLGDTASFVDLAIDAGPLSTDMRSTVVDARADVPFIFREGAISAEEINEALEDAQI
jgi:L-threonylcarbamoyladenylate synthase